VESVDDVAQDPQVHALAPPEVAAAATAAEAKSARDIVVLDVTGVSGITSYFLICSAQSDRQVKAIVGAIEEGVADIEGTRPLAIEGADTYEWVLMNYGYFMVHVFQQDAREFYDLERLWRDAPRCTW
jgi:ribosome-associated protein